MACPRARWTVPRHSRPRSVRTRRSAAGRAAGSPRVRRPGACCASGDPRCFGAADRPHRSRTASRRRRTGVSSRRFLGWRASKAAVLIRTQQDEGTRTIASAWKTARGAIPKVLDLSSRGWWFKAGPQHPRPTRRQTLGTVRPCGTSNFLTDLSSTRWPDTSLHVKCSTRRLPPQRDLCVRLPTAVKQRDRVAIETDLPVKHKTALRASRRTA